MALNKGAYTSAYTYYFNVYSVNFMQISAGDFSWREMQPGRGQFSQEGKSVRY